MGVCEPRVMFSASVGAAMGVLVSWIVNCALIEISVNEFFSFYFGLLFIMIGAVIWWRLRAMENVERVDRRPLLTLFAGMVIVAGCLCFLLDRNITRLHYLSKVPLYGILGVAVSFAFSFSIVDVGNAMAASCDNRHGIVDNPDQVNLVLIASATMGCLFGFSFGLLDLEDLHGSELRERLFADQLYFCYPVGLVVGAVAGFKNDRLRSEAPMLSRHFRDSDI